MHPDARPAARSRLWSKAADERGLRRSKFSQHGHGRRGQVESLPSSAARHVIARRVSDHLSVNDGYTTSNLLANQRKAEIRGEMS